MDLLDYLEMKYPTPLVFVLFDNVIPTFCSIYIYIYIYFFFFLLLFYYLFNISFKQSHIGSFLLPDPSDYTTTTQTISFTSGQGVGSTVGIAIPISEDNFAENTESFFGSLSLLPTNLNVEVTPNRTQILITDNDRKK